MANSTMKNTPSNLISIDNKLAQASYSLNLSEQRLLYILLSKIVPTHYGWITKEEVEVMSYEEMNRRLLTNDKKSSILTEGTEVDCVTLHKLTVQEYAGFCNITTDDARYTLIESSNHLVNRKITLRKDDGSFCTFGWVQYVEYEASSDTIGIRWSFGILPYIQNLTKYFTKLKLNSLLGLHSTYSWKLYQLLLSKKGENPYKKDIEIDYDSILFCLDVPISCREFKFFNSKILQKSLKEIMKVNLLTELTVKKVLKGRKVTGLVFSWESQSTKTGSVSTN